MKKESLEKKAWKGYGGVIHKKHRNYVSPDYYEEILSEVSKCGINVKDFSKQYEEKRAILKRFFPNIKLASEPEKLDAQFAYIIGSAQEYIKLKKPIETAEKYIKEERGLAGDTLYDAQERTAMVLADLPLKALRILSLRHGKEIMGGFYRE
ncbi:hypothetical protein HYT26_00510 [Candidatus Pacearchaeota archaeon]|nr:hypothetical protein [Candidatus Pacearchaeota archaeon]